MTGMLIHEWVEQSGGSEKVVEQFVKMFPSAPLHVLWDDTAGRFGTDTTESWLSSTPFRTNKVAALPLMPFVWRRLNPRASPDWLLVSSHLFAHHASVRRARQLPKFVYAHTPARYIWDPALDQRGDHPAVRLAGALLKPFDRRRAQEATSIAANSRFTRDRIRRSWGVDPEVIHPPVDTARIIAGGRWRDRLDPADSAILDSLPREFLLGASRFVSYKRLDLVIECGEAVGLPVVLAGSGPDSERLKSRAAASRIPVHFVPRPSDSLLYSLYQASMAFVFPAIEDFGIMPVEAMATGTPAIVPAEGGASESVSQVSGGSTFTSHTRADWTSALEVALRVNRGELSQRSSHFSNENFRRRVESWLSTHGISVPGAIDD